MILWSGFEASISKELSILSKGISVVISHEHFPIYGIRPLQLSLLLDQFFISSRTFNAISCALCCSVESCVRLFETPWTEARQASLSFTSSWSLLKLMSIESVMPFNHLILCHPFLLLPSIFPSIRVFSNESVLRIRWPEYWSFSFSISPSSEYSGLISFRMDWVDLLAVQGTLKSLLQYHSSKASILRCSAFFINSFIEI